MMDLIYDCTTWTHVMIAIFFFIFTRQFLSGMYAAKIFLQAVLFSWACLLLAAILYWFNISSEENLVNIKISSIFLVIPIVSSFMVHRNEYSAKIFAIAVLGFFAQYISFHFGVGFIAAIVGVCVAVIVSKICSQKNSGTEIKTT